MSPVFPRRSVLKSAAAAGAALAIGDLSFLRRLPQVSAADLQPNPKLVRLDRGIEPLVRLLEETSRDTLLEVVADRIRRGTTYQEVLAALMLATVRNVQPRPAVGFKFHAVLVVNSAHLASMASPDADRWLPIFWSLDYFKGRQLEEEKASGWKLGPPDETMLPGALRARTALATALDTWNEPAADAAVTALARTTGAQEIYELLLRYGARDYRSIGHKAIYVANSQRTLATIGWHHAEPILRSLVFALLNHQGEPNPATSDLEADRSGRRNHELLTKIRPDWLQGKPSSEATRELLVALRTGNSNEVADRAVELLNRGIAPQSIWDAVLVSSGELLMRQPGIIGLHTLTTANALRHAYDTSGDDATRRFALLQSCSFLPLFRQSAQGRGTLKEITVDAVTPVDVPADPRAALEDIFAEVSADRQKAAGKVLAYLQRGGEPMELIHAARRLVFLKGDDAHDYKFSSAVLEDFHRVSPEWQAPFLALSVFNLRGSGQRDNGLVQRARDALKT